MQPKNTICLWFDKDAEAAARFYAETFPDSKVTAVLREIDVAAIEKRGAAERAARIRPKRRSTRRAGDRFC